MPSYFFSFLKNLYTPLFSALHQNTLKAGVVFRHHEIPFGIYLLKKIIPRLPILHLKYITGSVKYDCNNKIYKY